MILYTDFTAQGYSITYNLNGGELGAGAPTSHTYGKDTALVDAVRVGYTFGGWYDNTAFSGQALKVIGATSITDNMTLYARWVGDVFVIEFRDMDGSEFGDEYNLPNLTHTNGTTTVLPTLEHSGQIRGINWTFEMYGAGDSIRHCQQTLYTTVITEY